MINKISNYFAGLKHKTQERSISYDGESKPRKYECPGCKLGITGILKTLEHTSECPNMEGKNFRLSELCPEPETHSAAQS